MGMRGKSTNNWGNQERHPVGGDTRESYVRMKRAETDQAVQRHGGKR